MNENFLSQGEIDALLGKKAAENQYAMSEIERDIIGEVGNISMSTAATTLSTILSRQVLITTPKVSYLPFKQIIEECAIPKVVADIEYKNGLSGKNLLMLDVKDATVIADLMMGGEGTNTNETLTELELSAVAEAMNQMIGSASTSMATMIGREVDILPPDVALWDVSEDNDYLQFDSEDDVFKIAFNLTVEGLIQSEIMQIFTRASVEEIVEIMMGDTSTDEEIVIEQDIILEEKPVELPKKEPVAEKVIVQKPEFQELTPSTDERKVPRNLDLIMDVPLEFSVVLGRTKKTIKEILSFGNGSVIELKTLADEPLEIYVNGKLIAQGEVVVINENFGVRITNILSKEQRVQNLK